MAKKKGAPRKPDTTERDRIAEAVFPVLVRNTGGDSHARAAGLAFDAAEAFLKEKRQRDESHATNH